MGQNKKLIYASDARKAVLKADPKLAYCIDNIPGVDAVEVLRCKDCYCYEQKYRGFGFCKYFDVGRADNDFCSSGGRKNDG